MAKNKQNIVKISAGEWRSRVLSFPDVEGLRPTPDRVRQTVFNWLGQDLTGQTCLDLFAGTGVMGFEALSRNAKSATLVELAKPAYLALQQNKLTLKAEHANIVRQDAMQYLASAKQSFDLIFCDPPFNQAWVDKILPKLTTLLNTDGIVYLEAEFGLESTPHADQWEIIKQKKAGNVHFHLLRPLAASQ